RRGWLRRCAMSPRFSRRRTSPRRRCRSAGSSTGTAVVSGAEMRLVPILLLLLASSAFAAKKDKDKDKDKEPDSKSAQLAKEGDRLYKDGKYREAADAMKQAYELDKNPVLLFNMARAYDQAGDL